MKRLILIPLFVGLFSPACLGQVFDVWEVDSVIIYSNSPTESKLMFISNCENAKLVAEQDIRNDNIKVVIVGGIAPIYIPTDKDFECKYGIEFYDYGDLPAKSECMYIYNSIVFNHLKEKFNKSWIKEIRKDVFGLKKWKKLE